MMESTARIFILMGIILVVIGGIVLLLQRTGIPFGHLPGDIRIEGKNGSLFFPLGTSILLSIVLTVLANFILRIFNK